MLINCGSIKNFSIGYQPTRRLRAVNLKPVPAAPARVVPARWAWWRGQQAFLDSIQVLSYVKVSQVVVALIGLGHIAGGVMLLWRQRSTLDRRRRTICTRDGWLGIKRRRYPLDQYSSICVGRVPRPWHYYSSLDTLFGISLTSQSGEAIVVGYAATDELAADIEIELRRFLENTPLNK